MGDDRGRFILASLFRHSPDSSAHTHTPIHAYMHMYVPLLTGAPLVAHTTTSFPPSFCLFRLSFSVCFGCWGFYQGFTHTMHTTTHTTMELQHFIATGLKEARLAPQGALLTLETPCLPWLSSKDNAQLSLALNQEAGEMEREPGDHSVLLGDFILFPSQHSTHMSIGEPVALQHEDSLRNHGKADTSTLTLVYYFPSN